MKTYTVTGDRWAAQLANVKWPPQPRCPKCGRFVKPVRQTWTIKQFECGCGCSFDIAV